MKEGIRHPKFLVRKPHVEAWQVHLNQVQPGQRHLVLDDPTHHFGAKSSFSVKEINKAFTGRGLKQQSKPKDGLRTARGDNASLQTLGRGFTATPRSNENRSSKPVSSRMSPVLTLYDKNLNLKQVQTDGKTRGHPDHLTYSSSHAQLPKRPNLLGPTESMTRVGSTNLLIGHSSQRGSQRKKEHPERRNIILDKIPRTSKEQTSVATLQSASRTRQARKLKKLQEPVPKKAELVKKVSSPSSNKRSLQSTGRNQNSFRNSKCSMASNSNSKRNSVHAGSMIGSSMRSSSRKKMVPPSMGRPRLPSDGRSAVASMQVGQLNLEKNQDKHLIDQNQLREKKLIQILRNHKAKQQNDPGHLYRVVRPSNKFVAHTSRNPPLQQAYYGPNTVTGFGLGQRTDPQGLPENQYQHFQPYKDEAGPRDELEKYVQSQLKKEQSQAQFQSLQAYSSHGPEINIPAPTRYVIKSSPVTPASPESKNLPVQEVEILDTEDDIISRVSKYQQQPENHPPTPTSMPSADQSTMRLPNASEIFEQSLDAQERPHLAVVSPQLTLGSTATQQLQRANGLPDTNNIRGQACPKLDQLLEIDDFFEGPRARKKKEENRTARLTSQVKQGSSAQVRGASSPLHQESTINSMGSSFKHPLSPTVIYINNQNIEQAGQGHAFASSRRQSPVNQVEAGASSPQRSRHPSQNQSIVTESKKGLEFSFAQRTRGRDDDTLKQSLHHNRKNQHSEEYGGCRSNGVRLRSSNAKDSDYTFRDTDKQIPERFKNLFDLQQFNWLEQSNRQAELKADELAELAEHNKKDAQESYFNNQQQLQFAESTFRRRKYKHFDFSFDQSAEESKRSKQGKSSTNKLSRKNSLHESLQASPSNSIPARILPLSSTQLNRGVETNHASPEMLVKHSTQQTPSLNHKDITRETKLFSENPKRSGEVKIDFKTSRLFAPRGSGAKVIKSKFMSKLMNEQAYQEPGHFFSEQPNFKRAQNSIKFNPVVGSSFEEKMSYQSDGRLSSDGKLSGAGHQSIQAHHETGGGSEKLSEPKCVLPKNHKIISSQSRPLFRQPLPMISSEGQLPNINEPSWIKSGRQQATRPHPSALQAPRISSRNPLFLPSRGSSLGSGPRESASMLARSNNSLNELRSQPPQNSSLNFLPKQSQQTLDHETSKGMDDCLMDFEARSKSVSQQTNESRVIKDPPQPDSPSQIYNSYDQVYLRRNAMTAQTLVAQQLQHPVTMLSSAQSQRQPHVISGLTSDQDSVNYHHPQQSQGVQGMMFHQQETSRQDSSRQELSLGQRSSRKSSQNSQLRRALNNMARSKSNEQFRRAVRQDLIDSEKKAQ